MTDPKRFNLFHFRWVIPIIDVLYAQKGGKYVTLLRELQISRSVLTSTLRKLTAQGFVMRNPGYGHPLRPEYLLTDPGSKLGPFCHEMMQCFPNRKERRHFLSKWAVQIIYLCSTKGEIRFSELKSALAPITSRALSEELKQLASEEYVERRIIEGYPPLTTYRPAKKSISIVQVIERHKHVLISFL